MNGYYYYRKFEKGNEYPIYFRFPENVDIGKAKIILDIQKLSKGLDYCYVSEFKVSRDNKLLAYTLDNNDMRFATNQGFNSGEQFFQYLKDSFDCLYKEGEHNPKMMSVGLHCRLIGRPGRMQSLIRFLDYVQNFDDVWICRRDEIADHWYKNYQ